MRAMAKLPTLLNSQGWSAPLGCGCGEPSSTGTEPVAKNAMGAKVCSCSLWSWGVLPRLTKRRGGPLQRER